VTSEARREYISWIGGFRRAQVVPLVGVLLVVLLFVWLGINLAKTPADFLSVVLEGLTLGLVYGLVALGYSLVYGILELINFAHGDVFMLGSWISLSVAAHKIGLNESSSGWHVVWGLALTLLAAMAFCGILNAAIERVAYRPLRNAPRLAPLITAIGMSFILQDVGLNRLGPAPVSVPNVLPKGTVFTIGGLQYRWASLIVALSTIPVLILLVWLVQKTRQGKAMRATAQDQEAAAMMGINVNRTISFTFLIAGALAGVAGLLYALYSTNIRYDQGFSLGLIAFTAAVLGGIGSIPGAVLGGLLLGIAESVGPYLLLSGVHAPSPFELKGVITFSILVLVLIFRPGGILGTGEADKV
jgi:branched-chain amino acid transport system permease protein